MPRLVRQSPANVAGAYLRGLFEADGGLSHGYPQLNTTSQRLAQEVATLLIGLGCPVTIRSADYSGRLGKRPQWIVRITSHVGLEAWRQRIGCDRRSRFVGCYTFRPDVERESSYPLPHRRIGCSLCWMRLPCRRSTARVAARASIGARPIRSCAGSYCAICAMSVSLR